MNDEQNKIPLSQAVTEARPGPRPLAFHLASAVAALGGSAAALPAIAAGNLETDASSGIGAEAAELAAALAGVGEADLLTALGAETSHRLTAMLSGIEAYRNHPYRRELPDPPVLWSEGSTRLLDYGSASDGEACKTVLFAPSLVNRGYVLDLSARRSMLRWMARHGLRPLLVDWGTPGPGERNFSLDDYILGRLGGALDAATDAAGGPVPLVGYCMGGDLALAAAQHRSRDVSALALLATPWDFHAGSGLHSELFKQVGGQLKAVIEGFGELPVDILQTFFASLDPALGLRKFRGFLDLDLESDKADDFVALEDWLNDGVPLTAAVAETCLIEWYGDNTPARGQWRIGGQIVDPDRINIPTLVAAPGNDRIVPPESAQPLAELIPGAHLLVPPSGHIGMVVGGKAEAGLWRPLLEWLLKNG